VFNQGLVLLSINSPFDLHHKIMGRGALLLPHSDPRNLEDFTAVEYGIMFFMTLLYAEQIIIKFQI
jgi:hypothetical protein